MATLLRALFNAGPPVDIFDGYRWLREFPISPPGAIPLGGDDQPAASYYALYKYQPWVNAVIRKLAGGIARLPLKTYQRNGDSRVRVHSDASSLAAVLQRPNSSKETGTPKLFKGRVMNDLCVYGNAMVIKEQTAPDQPVTQMWPTTPTRWSVDEDGYYIYRAITSGELTKFEPWRVMHFMEPMPSGAAFGFSRMEALRRTLALEDAAQRLGVATFANGARPSGLISVKEELSQAGADRFKEQIMKRFSGPDKAGLPAVLEGDATWQPMSFNLDDSAVVSHRQLTRTEVCAVYDVPPPIVHILDQATFSNIETQHLMLYVDTLGPWATLLEESIAAQLIDGVPEYEGQFVEFDINEVVKGDITTRATAYAQFIHAGVYTPNELRARENLPPSTSPEADIIHVPINLSGAPKDIPNVVPSTSTGGTH